MAQTDKDFAGQSMRRQNPAGLCHIPADGNIYLTDNTKYHTAINGGEEDRIHLVATVLGTK